jgi:segregation and condensation protein A
MSETESYQVKLEIFEGPMDLLLYLIRKHEVDVYDIPVAMIVEQYMAYIDLMQKFNMDLAGDFLVMAATLSHIKSQLLLPPVGGEEEGEEIEDPRADLVRRLLDYQRYKDAADELMERDMLGRDVFVRPPSTEAIQEAAEASGIPDMTFMEVGVFALFEAFRDVMERSEISNWHEVTMERISIMDRINQILDILKDVESISFSQLFTEVTNRSMVIATFLAILELIRLNVIKAFQDKTLGPIHLVRSVEINDEWLTENLPNLDIEKG